METPVGPATILVVDDSAQNRELAEGQLTSAGLSVVEADSGAAALAAFAASTPDLVLLDIVMPGMDGIETCRRLRALPEGTNVPIVFLTAYGDAHLDKDVLECGGDDFLIKPIRRIELLIRVRSLLRLRRVTQKLEERHAAMERLARQKADLMELVVHDFKTPVTTILANLEYALETPGLPEVARDALLDGAAAAEALRRRVLNLLDMSRNVDGSLAPRRTPTDVAQLVQAVAQQFRGHAGRLGLHLEAPAAGRPIVAALDTDMFRRVVENLLDNALAHAPRGGTVRIELTAEDDAVTLAVAGPGPAIAPENRERIFQRYVQLDGSPTVAGGRGLGLSFCRLAAEAHGGRVWLEDLQPSGSVFRVRVPRTG